MKLILDANILFAALIRDGSVRSIILKSTDQFYTPAYVIMELRAHQEMILEKSGYSLLELEELLALLLRCVTVVPDPMLLPYRFEAMAIIGAIDANDAPYVACALAVNGAIWSDDKDLKLQSDIPVFSTADIAARHINR